MLTQTKQKLEFNVNKVKIQSDDSPHKSHAMCLQLHFKFTHKWKRQVYNVILLKLDWNLNA